MAALRYTQVPPLGGFVQTAFRGAKPGSGKIVGHWWPPRHAAMIRVAAFRQPQLPVGHNRQDRNLGVARPFVSWVEGDETPRITGRAARWTVFAVTLCRSAPYLRKHRSGMSYPVRIYFR